MNRLGIPLQGGKVRYRGRFQKGQHWRPCKPWWDRQWLVDQYVDQGKSASDIAAEWGVTAGAILFWLRKHGVERRSVSEARSRKHWGVFGHDNPMWGQTGDLNPRWTGGSTPERQAFYASQEWKSVCAFVWKRDSATCRRCRSYKQSAADVYHIHHIVPFSNKDLRANPDNLVLLCGSCHKFVHSKLNVERRFLPGGPCETK